MMAVLYRPRLQWQGDPSDDDPFGWVDCTAFAFAMGIDAISRGAVTPSGGEIRRLTDELTPTPGDPGLTLEQVAAAGRRMGADFVLTRGRWAAVARDLLRRRWLVVGVWYPLMGIYREQKPGNFGHALGLMALSTDGKSVLVYDPLRQEGKPRWVPITTLRPAMEEWGRRGLGLPSGDMKWLTSDHEIPTV